MCLKEVLQQLQSHGVSAQSYQVRYAIETGRVSRPRLDASLRFDFNEANVSELVEHFNSRQAATV